MERRGPNVTDADVSAFEATIGATLPNDYRVFLLEVNGGRTADTAVKFPLRAGHRSNLNSLRSLNDPKSARNLAEANDNIRRGWGLPRELLAIGSDDGGAAICLCIHGEHRGEIWYFDTIDARPTGANPRVLWHDRRDMIQLADSFRAFMASLTPLE
jgi:hypothetical protein